MNSLEEVQEQVERYFGTETGTFVMALMLACEMIDRAAEGTITKEVAHAQADSLRKIITNACQTTKP